MKSLANPYSFFMGIRAHYKIGAHMDNGLSAEVGPIIALSEATMADIPAATDAHPEVDIAAHIWLCRDKCRTVRLILKPRSIMILGGRKRWRPTAEHRLASVLK
jgi:hypothetical protein